MGFVDTMSLPNALEGVESGGMDQSTLTLGEPPVSIPTQEMRQLPIKCQASS